MEPKAVCQALLKRGLITRGQVRKIFEKREPIQRQIEKRRTERQSVTGARISNPATIIDVIASLKFKRADNAFRKVDEELIFQVLAREWKIPYKKIDPLKLDLNFVTTTIPRTFALRHLVLPINVENGLLTVATPDPFNMEVMDDITRVSNFKVRPVVSAKSEIIKLIHEFFGFKRSIVAAESQFGASAVDLGNLEQYVRLSSAEELPANDQHIVNAVNHLLVYAFDQRASDIHIEPKRDVCRVRMRLDGILHTIYNLPKKVHNAIVSRIKAMSRLDMAEKRKPQDGRIKTDKGGTEAEIRISTVPVAFGEKVVMRIMDPDILLQDLNGLGFSPADLTRYDQFVNLPHGIVLVCGPTGSGKSTTLYSTLRKLSTSENNVVTIEDPIEMVHEDFNQIAVQPAVNITFSTILRTILRQDPDIIMVGEMRDLETARNAIQAALTGHLVLSTLHTNDAPSSVTRLLELGVPSYMIQATLGGVLAQRLVRKICLNCKESFMMDASELRAMGLEVGKKERVKLHRGKGCVKCRNTGYRGRTGVFEVLPYSESIRKMTTGRANVENIRIRAREEGMVTLRESAVKKMLSGDTTFDEVLRVTWEMI
ncbi:MAG: type II/IV secretion system protein [Desulfobacterales bacterium]|nr:type II/IV secretion system protein [Desulfobacterales bacterium]